MENHAQTESRLLGCFLLDGGTIDRALAAGITAAHWHAPFHSEQFRLLCDLRLAGKSTDLEGIYAATASDPSRLQLVGGIPALLLHQQETSLHAGDLIAAVIANYGVREAHRLFTSGAADLKAGRITADDARSLAEQVVGVCSGNVRVQRRLSDMDAEIEESLKAVETGQTDKDTISWGLPKLDRFLKPIARNEYFLVCARPSRGKTSMLTHLAGYNLSHGKRVAYFNLEDADTEIIKKMAAQMAGICVGEWANLTADQRAAFRTYKSKIVNSKNFLVFDKDNTLEAIQARCRLLAQSFKPHLVLIDYLGCLRLPGKSIYESVSTVSKAMPQLRKVLNCALGAGQQLKRLEDGDREPGLQDLRDSGQLEEDAARVAMLHWKDSRFLDVDHREYSILQPKYRFGPTTAVTGITFHAPTTRFYEAAHGN